jgi:hypothetical protein
MRLSREQLIVMSTRKLIRNSSVISTKERQVRTEHSQPWFQKLGISNFERPVHPVGGYWGIAGGYWSIGGVLGYKKRNGELTLLGRFFTQPPLDYYPIHSNESGSICISPCNGGEGAPSMYVYGRSDFCNGFQMCESPRCRSRLKTT